MTDPATTTRLHPLALQPMRSVRCAVVALLLVACGGPLTRAKAEDAAPKAAPPTASTAEAIHPKGPIEYVGPDTYILLDAQGRPQPVPGMTYEDFLAAWKKLNQSTTPDSKPRFTIESIKSSGQTHGQRAELKLDFTIHLLADGPIEVPLGLVGAILQGEPRFTSPDAARAPAADEKAAKSDKQASRYVDFDPQRGGFVARTEGAAGERQEISLNLIVPLLRGGAETTLPLNLPRSTSSSLKLTVDTPFTEARATSGAITAQKSTDDGGTAIEVAGPSGQFRLAWQVANSDRSSITSVLNAIGAIHVTVDGRGVRSDAKLSVRSFGGAFDQFRVRLPRGAKLVRDPAAAGSVASNYRITEEPTPASSAKGGAAVGDVVLVELKEKQQGPVEIELSTEQPGQDESQAVEISGFEVIGAVRQYGDIALNVGSDWQARWNTGRDVRQVDPNELEAALQRTDLTAAFQYDRQPWSIDLRVSPRQSRVHVTPQYELELLPDEARLNVRLSYQNFGARTFKFQVFQVEIDGWELSGEPVESGGLIDQDGVSVSSKGTLSLPLAQASSRKAEVAFSLRHPIDREATLVRLPFPVPVADSVATGEVTVRSPAEIELLPDMVHSTGLAASPAREVGTSTDLDAPTELHFRSLSPAAVLVASRTNRSRDAAAQVNAQVDITSDAVQVDEQIEYLVRYEATKELVLEVPSDFPLDIEETQVHLLAATNSESTARQQGTPLHVDQISDDDPEGAGIRHVRVTLPQPHIGKFKIAVRYQLDRAQLTSNFSALQVPLLAPADARVTSQQATVHTPKGVFASLATNVDSSSWKSLSSKRDAAAPTYEFTTDRAEPVLPLVVSTADQSSPSTTVVERVWLQTWLSGGIEQDRAVFRLRTSNSQTTVELPPDAPAGAVEVLVDKQPAEVSARAAGRIVVRLAKEPAADSAEQVTHTLEVRFRRPIQQTLISRHRITPPQVDATTELSQVYWQIILPADEHIVRAPNQLVAASQWQWLGAFWGRRPTMLQGDLEKWIGGSTQIAPAPSDNQYLFNGLLPVSSIALVTAPRWIIVLMASGLTLLLLAGWFYLPMRTKPWMLVGGVAAIAAAAIAYPTAAVLIAQASAIGIILAPLTMLLSRLMGGRPPRRFTPSISPSSQRVITPRSDSIMMPPVVAAASTAPTVTLRTSDSQR